jgi:two-component system, NarL family, nitrate/nitrite sensor histidine kinase NarX
MKNSSIQGSLGLLFAAFFLLVAVSAGATIWGIESQKTDALVVNLAGRQRMLVQQMTRLALEMEAGAGVQQVTLLEETAFTFDQTLQALKDGGSAPYLAGQSATLPVTRDASIRSQLDRLSTLWFDYRAELHILANTAPGSPAFQAAVRQVETFAPILAAEADLVVRQYESAANLKLLRLRWIQVAFTASALSLLVAGAIITRRAVIRPLQQLGEIAHRIGGDNLGEPVQVSGLREIDLLAASLESMRSQLQATQGELVAWAATLEERVDQRTRELRALYQVTRDISSRLEIGHVLERVTTHAGELLDSDVAFLCLLDEAGRRLALHSIHGPSDAVLTSSTMAETDLPARILAGTSALPCRVDGCQGSCGIMTETFRASHLAAPLRMGERVIGALCVGSSRQGAFSADDQQLLTRLANSAVIALENARLYAQAERLGVLEERQRIAAEMHDGLAQTLSSVRMSLDLASDLIQQGQTEHALETIDSIDVAVDQGVAEVRRAIASLQQDFPLRFTLQEQLQQLVDEYTATGAPIEWRNCLNSPLILPPEESEQVLRVAGEALLNAIHHAQARSIILSLEQIDERLQLTISDDGIGFDPIHPPSTGHHFGLTIMRARAARLAGRLAVESSPGNGTRLSLAWKPPRDG